MKKLLVALVVAAAALILLFSYAHHERDSDRAAAAATPVEKAVPAPATMPASANATAPSPLKKISPEERRALEQRIDASRAAHGQAATRAGEQPHLPKTGKLEDLPPGVLDTVKQALPLLDACYNHGSKNYGENLAVAQVTLHGAADVGTIVNADEFHDEKGTPIDKDVAECMASTLQSLQLPPIDMDVPVQFSFRY